MYEGGVSDALESLLIRDGMTTAKRQLDRVNKRAGRSHEGARRQSADTAGGGEPHRHTAGEGSTTPIGISEVGATKAPAVTRGSVKQPSPVSRPVLVALNTSARPRDRMHRPLRLELVVDNT